MSKKIYYEMLAALVIIALALNLKPNNSSITMMYIHIAEHCSNAKMYALSNFYYTVAQKMNKKTTWLDYNIAKNIVACVWDKPLTPYKKAMLQEALRHLDIEIKKYPNNADINAEYAYAYEQLKDYDKAIEYYKKCVNKIQNWQYGYYRLAFLYSHVKMEYEIALKYLDKALELKSDDTECWFLKGRTLGHLERYQEAIECYQKYLDHYPNSVAALVNISGCEVAVKDYDSAQKHVDLGLKYNKTSSYLISNKIDILMYRHKFDEAILESNRMLERDMVSGYLAYWSLAEIARYQGKSDEAERFYTLAKENAQKFYDKYCSNPYDLSDIDAECTNHYYFLKDFEKNKAKKLDF